MDMGDLLRKFRDDAYQSLNESERKHIGDSGTGVGFDSRVLDESVASVRSYNAPNAPRPLRPYQGKESDGEMVFVFEYEDDAMTMYDFFVESKLLEPGEIVYRSIEGQFSVAFASSVLVQKPEMIEAALYAYGDDLYFEDDEAQEAFESEFPSAGEYLTERRKRKVYKVGRGPSTGVRKKPGNPFHEPGDGKFTGAKGHIDSGMGSYAKGKVKLKFTGSEDAKDGTTTVHYGSTKHPCGRAARAKGLDILCHSGEPGASGRAVGRAAKRKARKESLDVFDLSAIFEMRDRYSKLR